MQYVTSKGRFGTVCVYKLFGFPIAVKMRTRKYEELRIVLPSFFKKDSFRLVKYRLPRSFAEADDFNDRSNVVNCFEIQKIKNNFPRVLYILDDLIYTGGVERRLELQFDWMIRHGIQPIVVAKSQGYAPLSRYPWLRFRQDGACSEEKLIDLICWTDAKVVEFNMKDSRFFQDVDLLHLRQYARIGCMIHGVLDVEQKQLDKLDYRCATREHANIFRNIAQIPNTVLFPEKFPIYNPNSRRALYIGRMDHEKLDTVENFIQICKKFDFEYDIAGPVFSSKKFRYLCERYKVKDSSWIGPVDARFFLQKRGGEYAFVAGVGQVPLESSAVNLPSLVVAHDSDPDRSVFITRDNLKNVIEENCVLRNVPTSLVPGNVDDFMKAKTEGERLKCEGWASYFQTRDLLYEFRNQDAVFNKYAKILRPFE